MKKIFSMILLTLVLTACGSNGSEEVAENAKGVVTCSNGWLEYTVESTPMKFCYDAAWGDVVVAKQEASTGELVKISFSKLADGAPTVWYESTDYPGDGSYHLDPNKVRITGSEDMIKTQLIDELGFPYKAEEFNLRKSDAGGARALRLHIESGDLDYIKYYVGNAFEGYNVILSADQEYAGDLDEMVYHIQF